MEDPGGVEPLGARIKSPLPNHLGLERSGSIDDGYAATSRPGFVIVVIMMFSCLLVLPHGNDPRSSGYRPGALPLSYGRILVLRRGLEPRVPCMSCRKLTKRVWCSLQDSNLGMSVWWTDALAAWPSERARRGGVAASCGCMRGMMRNQKWCTREDLNLHALRRPLLRRLRLPFRHECIDGAATADRTPVTALPKRCPATGRLRPRIETGAGWRTRTPRLSLTRRVLFPMS